MKNPHGVEPTRFLKRKESDNAIYCNPGYGPLFGKRISDIHINNECYKENSCWITCNDKDSVYEYHPEYKSTLFVNTAGPDNINRFSVLDYEVYEFSLQK